MHHRERWPEARPANSTPHPDRSRNAPAWAGRQAASPNRSRMTSRQLPWRMPKSAPRKRTFTRTRSSPAPLGRTSAGLAVWIIARFCGARKPSPRTASDTCVGRSETVTPQLQTPTGIPRGVTKTGCLPRQAARSRLARGDGRLRPPKAGVALSSRHWTQRRDCGCRFRWCMRNVQH